MLSTGVFVAGGMMGRGEHEAEAGLADGAANLLGLQVDVDAERRGDLVRHLLR